MNPPTCGISTSTSFKAKAQLLSPSKPLSCTASWDSVVSFTTSAGMFHEGNLSISAQLVSPWVLEDVLNLTPCYTQLNHADHLLFQEPNKDFPNSLWLSDKGSLRTPTLFQKPLWKTNFRLGVMTRPAHVKMSALPVILGVESPFSQETCERIRYWQTGALLLELLLRLVALRPIECFPEDCIQESMDSTHPKVIEKGRFSRLPIRNPNVNDPRRCIVCLSNFNPSWHVCLF